MKRLLLIAALLLVAATAWSVPVEAVFTPTDFHVPHNTLSNTGNEGYAKLIDQNKSTKWCVVNNSGAWETIWLDVESDVLLVPNSYILTTANDTKTHPTRNPKEWVLYGKTLENDQWTELAHVTDGGGLQAVNTTDYTFPLIGITQGYRYFRFEVRQINGKDPADNNYTFQLAELTLSGTKVMDPENYEPALTPTNFHVPHNTLSNTGNEGYAKLIDRKKSTKWCVVNKSGAWETIWLDFKTDVMLFPKSYTLTTGNDTQNSPTRNPKEWVLYGKTLENDEWTELSHVTDGGGLQAVNTTDYTFPLTGINEGYHYFRFEVRQINGKDPADNNYTFQLAELTLIGTQDPENYVPTLIPTDFHVSHNTLSNTGNEGFAKLIDQDKSTKWCVVNNSGAWETIWLDFKADELLFPKSYILTTGNDTQNSPTRNPKEWVLYGKTLENDEWTELAHVTDGGGLQAVNTTDYTFPLTGISQGCRYFRFEVRQINGKDPADNNYTFQLAELTLSGAQIPPIGPPLPNIPGDLNSDGQVDIADVNAVINMMLGKAFPTPVGDVTGDDSVDIADVNAVINMMLGKTQPSGYPTPHTLTATGFNVPHNGLDNNGDEGYTKLVDGNKSTKWCVENRTGAWETIWIDLKSEVAFRPTSYILTTGNDTNTCPTRNPKNWKIYGRNSESESWTELVHVTDGAQAGLGTENTTDYTFQFSGISQAYKYYRFEVIENSGADKYNAYYYIFQLAELTLVGLPQ